VTSNWPFKQWTNFLPDAATATAILAACCLAPVERDVGLVPLGPAGQPSTAPRGILLPVLS
jgi:hypothetical protein